MNPPGEANPEAKLQGAALQEGPTQNRRATTLLVVIALVRLGLAALVFARPGLALQNDTDRYVPIAKSILSGQAYAWNTDRPGELLNTVGYPLFLAGVYALGGTAAGAVALAQLLLTGVLGLILYLGLRRPLGRRPAFVAALIVLLDPLTMLWSMTIMTEALFAVILGMAALLLFRWAESRRNRTLVFVGILLGLASLVKPYGLLLAAFWGVAVVLRKVESTKRPFEGLARRFVPAAVMFLPIALLVLPWVVRNTLLWNCPSLSPVDKVTMRDYVAAKVLQETQKISLEQAQSQLQARDPGVCPRGNAEYVGLILAHPQIFAKLHIAGTMPVVLGTGFDRWLEFLGVDYTLPDLWGPYMDGGLGAVASVLANELARFPWSVGLMSALSLWQLALYGAAILGVLAYKVAPSPGIRWSIVVVGISVLILVLTPGQGGHERFRVPVQPLLAMLAAFGLAWRARPLLRQSSAPRSGKLPAPVSGP